MSKPDAVIFKTEHYSYYYFKPFNAVIDPTPTHLQPPFAGRGYEVTENQIRICQSAGRHVYVFILHNAIPWYGKPFSMEDFITAIDKCQTYAREKHGVKRLDVVADCQGGVVTAIHNALNPTLYRRHSFFATPMNNKTGLGGIIEDYCKTADMNYHRMRVAMNGGVQLGIDQYLAFSMVDPYDAILGRWFKLSKAIMYETDEEKCKQKVSNSLWRDNVKNLHGLWYLFTMEFFFINNCLYDGTMVLNGKVVDLGNIICPVHIYVGGDDCITLPKSSKGIAEKVNSEEVHFTCFDANSGFKRKTFGHTTPFADEECLTYFKNEFYTTLQINFN